MPEDKLDKVPVTDRAFLARFKKLDYQKEFTSKNGIKLRLVKKVGDKIEVFEGEKLVFLVDGAGVEDGWLEVDDIFPVGKDGDGIDDSMSEEFKRLVGQGIGRAIYDALEESAHTIGAKGIRPNFGWLSSDAIRFWKKRLRHLFPDLKDEFLEELLNIPYQKDVGQPQYGRRVQKSLKMFEELYSRRVRES
jgi:hypothetical protein